MIALNTRSLFKARRALNGRRRLLDYCATIASHRPRGLADLG
ncbi:hypothetical protein [Nonomuraea terrae]|nr:hypothetical protein [Nonomuraea terrae]